MPRFSPAQPQRIFHPPALSLPRQPLRPRPRLSADGSQAKDTPGAYPLGRTVRRIRSITFVRAAERGGGGVPAEELPSREQRWRTFSTSS
jgi:hypothetical protein